MSAILQAADTQSPKGTGTSSFTAAQTPAVITGQTFNLGGQQAQIVTTAPTTTTQVPRTAPRFNTICFAGKC